MFRALSGPLKQKRKRYPIGLIAWIRFIPEHGRHDFGLIVLCWLV